MIVTSDWVNVYVTYIKHFIYISSHWRKNNAIIINKKNNLIKYNNKKETFKFDRKLETRKSLTENVRWYRMNAKYHVERKSPNTILASFFHCNLRSLIPVTIPPPRPYSETRQTNVYALPRWRHRRGTRNRKSAWYLTIHKFPCGTTVSYKALISTWRYHV